MTEWVEKPQELLCHRRHLAHCWSLLLWPTASDVGANGCRAPEIVVGHDEVGLSFTSMREDPKSGLGDFSVLTQTSRVVHVRVWTPSLQRSTGSVTPDHPPHQATRHGDEKGIISGKDQPSSTDVRLHALDTGASNGASGKEMDGDAVNANRWWRIGEDRLQTISQM